MPTPFIINRHSEGLATLAGEPFALLLVSCTLEKLPSAILSGKRGVFALSPLACFLEGERIPFSDKLLEGEVVGDTLEQNHVILNRAMIPPGCSKDVFATPEDLFFLSPNKGLKFPVLVVGCRKRETSRLIGPVTLHSRNVFWKNTS